jgi:hypothetical protein
MRYQRAAYGHDRSELSGTSDSGLVEQKVPEMRGDESAGSIHIEAETAQSARMQLRKDANYSVDAPCRSQRKT